VYDDVNLAASGMHAGGSRRSVGRSVACVRSRPIGVSAELAPEPRCYSGDSSCRLANAVTDASSTMLSSCCHLPATVATWCGCFVDAMVTDGYVVMVIVVGPSTAAAAMKTL